jgi:Ca-activated chloride channel family protein
MTIYEYSFENTKPSYLKDKTARLPYPDAISKIDEANLQTIAREVGGDYIHMTSPSDVSQVINKLNSQVVYTSADGTTELFQDTYYFFAIPLFAILLYVLIDIKRNY